MQARHLAAAMMTLLSVPALAEAQDPTWTVIRPTVTWGNQWSVQPAGQPLFAVLNEPIYRDRRPRVDGDRAVATRPRERFSVGFGNVAVGGGDFSGGAVWVHLAIQRGTRVDVAVRTRRNGRVTIVSRRARLTPPIVGVPEDPPRGRRGFRGWIDLTVPALTRADVNRLSLSVRISPSSPQRSLARVHAAFAELYPAS